MSRRQQIREHILSGKTNKEIAELFNITSQAISHHRQLMGYTRPLKIKPLGKRALRLKRTGLTASQLSAAVLKFQAKKRNAKNVGHQFEITFDEVVWNTTCPILGIPLDYFSEGRTHNSVSFDRINPSKGYISDNVQIISWRANNLKNNGTLKEFEAIVYFLKNSMIS